MRPPIPGLREEERMRRAPSAFLVLSLLAGMGVASGQPFDPDVPSPGSVLGFEPASRPARCDEIVRYYEALAAATPRAKLTEYGRTHEGRPLVYLTITDEKHMVRLGEIQKELQRLGDPRRVSREEAARLAKDTPAVAWLGYSIHGDELSSSDAALVVAYRLAAGMDEETRMLRRELIVHLDPAQNPDGRERFLAMLTAFSNVVPNPDPESVSHRAFWPWGRGNHYLFDLNRDWFALVHPESRGRAKAISSWWPQLMVDSHEMGSHDTYLFHPPRHPFNPHMPPSVLKWATPFGEDQAAAFDEHGWSYYTGEWNEEFFPGYGSAWATYGGSVGILYEQAGTEGTVVQQKAGTLLDYPEAVDHQVVSSWANILTTARNREALLTDWAADRRAAVERGRKGPIRAFVIPAGRRARRLVDVLATQGIEVWRNGPVQAKLHDLHDPWSAQPQTVEFGWGGSYVVPLDQPLAPLARVLLDFHVPMTPEFLREEREHLEREKGSRLYETTAWSLPLTYGVEVYWTGRNPVPWRHAPRHWYRAGGGDAYRSAGFFEGRYGYLFDGSTDHGAFALARLLQEGTAVRVGRKPLSIAAVRHPEKGPEVTELPRGTVLVKREGNPEDVRGILGAAAAKNGLDVLAVDTAWSEEKPDLGGREFRPLVEPRVAVLTGDSISFTSYGAIWHLLDRTMEFRFSGLDIARFGETDLSRYNVLVLPHAWAGPHLYRGRLGEAGIAKLKGWIEAGGTVVGIKSGAFFLADERTGIGAVRPRAQVLDAFPPVVLGPDAATAEAAGAARATGLRATGDEDASPAVSPYHVPPVVGPGARPFLGEGATTYSFPKELVGLGAWAEPVAPEEDEAREAFLARADARLRRFHPHGAFLRVDTDPDHWLTYGMDERVPVHFSSRDALVADRPVETVARFAGLEELHLSGLLWPEAAGRIARSAYLTREKMGKGQVILFADDPVYRGSSWATQRLFLNAILLGPGLGADWSVPW
jgi:hypothetical protein